MRIATALLGAVCSLAAAWPGTAAVRKAATELSVDALISETQSTFSTTNSLDLVWFVPIEFWQAAARDPSIDAARRESMIASIESYFIIITVQADISPEAAFDFFELKPQALYRVGSGAADTLEPLAEWPPELTAMIGVMKPLLSQALGPLGAGVSFHVYSDRDQDGARRVSPYDNGSIEVAMHGRDSQIRSQHRIELPLDALHIPRLCANGKPAHISWTHCPWDGTKLPE